MDNRIHDIIVLLSKQTKEGTIKWDATGTANEFKVDMKGGTVVINSFMSSGGVMFFTFKVFNLFGILAVQETCSKVDEEYPVLFDLFYAAKDSFTQKDSVLDSILEQLKQ